MLAVAFWLAGVNLGPSASAAQFILHDELCSWPVQPGVLDHNMPPIKARITVILVAAGDTFQKPVGWDEYGKLELSLKPAK